MTRHDLQFPTFFLQVKQSLTFFFKENIWSSETSLDGLQILFGDYLNKNTQGSAGSRD